MLSRSCYRHILVSHPARYASTSGPTLIDQLYPPPLDAEEHLQDNEPEQDAIPATTSSFRKKVSMEAKGIYSHNGHTPPSITLELGSSALSQLRLIGQSLMFAQVNLNLYSYDTTESLALGGVRSALLMATKQSRQLETLLGKRSITMDSAIMARDDPEEATGVTPLETLPSVKKRKEKRENPEPENPPVEEPQLNRSTLMRRLRQINSSIDQLRRSKKPSVQKGASRTPESPEIRVLKAERVLVYAQLDLAKQHPPWKPATSASPNGKILKPTETETEEVPSHVDKDSTPSLWFSRTLGGVLHPSGKATLEDVDPPSGEHRHIARLEHGLDRVLFNPNVHWVRDPRSKVYNFSPDLETVPRVPDFAFERLTGFIPSSRDEELASLAKAHNKRFAGSTSSLSGFLSHIYYLISQHRPPDFAGFSAPFKREAWQGFSGGTKIASSIIFRKSPLLDNFYSLDSLGDKEEEGKNVLTFLGTMLEKYLTQPASDFQKLRRGYTPVDGEIQPVKEAYRYSKSAKFVMRSQLDCQDVRLPGTGVFDIKTRACIAIRGDRLNWEENAGYQIRTPTGLYESFEREYFDLIRSAFLKYQFQVRIGDMDGVFVAYHNTEKLFGFQYISLDEMDARLFGGPLQGQRAFESCVGLLEVLAEEIVNCFPGESVQCLVETKRGDQHMKIWVRPVPADTDTINVTGNGPMALIYVNTQHYLNKKPLGHHKAISSPSNNWALNYTITHVDDEQEIWSSYFDAINRKNMAMYLPGGVRAQDFLKQWHSIDYGRPGSEAVNVGDDEADASGGELLKSSLKFLPASKRIMHLRKLAKKGHDSAQADASTGTAKVTLLTPRNGLTDDLDDAVSQPSVAEIESHIPHDDSRTQDEVAPEQTEPHDQSSTLADEKIPTS